MSMSQVLSFAIIGVELAIADDDFGGSRKASCAHDFEVDDSNFCPYCGTPVEVGDTTKYSADPTLRDFVLRMEEKLPDGYVIMQSRDDRVFVGYGMMTDLHNPVREMPWPPIDGEEVANALKLLLDPYDLYDPATFGLYNVMSETR